LRVTHLILPSLAVLALSSASGATAAGGAATATAKPKVTPKPTASTTSGGAGIGASPGPISTPSHPIVRGFVAKIIKGVAYAPSYAPIQVQRAIWAGNRIRRKPYIYGGGHGSFNDVGYDCSGSVSYVLHAAGLVDTPMDSSEFMSWGHNGLGRWITVYSNPGHAFVQIAGVRFDTSAEADPHPAPGSGPHWRPLFPHPGGSVERHPGGF
jgi:hypothetical protein